MSLSSVWLFAVFAACEAGPFDEQVATVQSALITSGSFTALPTTGLCGSLCTFSAPDADGVSEDWIGGNWVVQLPVGSGYQLGTVSAPVRDNAGASGNTVSMTVVSSTGTTYGSARTTGSGTTQQMTAFVGRTVGNETISVIFRGLNSSNGPATLQSTVGVVSVGSGSSITTIAIDGSAFRPITPDTTVDYQSGCTFQGGLGVAAPVTLPQGATVTAARFFIADNTTGPTILQGAVQGRTQGDQRTGVVSAGSDGSGLPQTLAPIVRNPVVITTSTGYSLQVTYFQGSGAANVAFAELDYH